MATPLFLRKFRFVLRLGCPLSASNSTLSSRKVFFRRTCRRKNDCNSFAAHKRRNSCFYHGSGSGKKSRSNRQAPASEGTSSRFAGQTDDTHLGVFFFLKHRRGATIPGHFMSANRAASSKQPRFNRHRRRFGCYPPPPAAHLLFLWARQRKRRWGAENSMRPRGRNIKRASPRGLASCLCR